MTIEIRIDRQQIIEGVRRGAVEAVRTALMEAVTGSGLDETDDSELKMPSIPYSGLYEDLYGTALDGLSDKTDHLDSMRELVQREASALAADVEKLFDVYLNQALLRLGNLAADRLEADFPVAASSAAEEPVLLDEAVDPRRRMIEQAVENGRWFPITFKGI